MPKIITEVRCNNDFLFSEDEVNNIYKTAGDVIELLKSKNLTHIEASEVLRISKTLLEVKAKLN